MHNRLLRFVGIAALVSSIFGTTSCVSPKSKPATTLRDHNLLDAGWLFHRGDLPADKGVTTTDFADGEWTKINLPHDYILDGVYNKTNDRHHGYLPYMPAWYRKHFVIPQSDEGKILQLQFDGVFRDSQVWLNGHLLGKHPSGYTPFYFDITKIANIGGENVLAVRVDPTKFEGWWYEGGGIYRHVFLNALSPLHVATYGTYVVSTVPKGNQGADDEADVTVETTPENSADLPANCEVVSEIVQPNGRVLRTLKESTTVAAQGKETIVQRTVLANPQLWSLESPHLYQLRTTLLQDGRPVDSTTTTFGIRTIFFDPNNGFFLNGQHVEIDGAACHQDFPGFGIAVPDSLQPWRVQQLKKLGCNGWRTAHNAPTEAVLDACDRLGMLVMDENRHLGDTQAVKTATNTPYKNLPDLAAMIQRDRNHPSIIMWSMCNEEHLQGTPEGAKIFTAMKNLVHQYDKTRPVTCAMNAGWTSNGIASVDDIIGVNYSTEKYEKIHKAHPHQAMYGSETCNEKTARGVYQDDKTNGLLSAYHLSDKSWQGVARHPFMSGMYMWTGIDYKGEPNPDGWPDVSNNTGLMDACGFPKDKGYFFKSWWDPMPMVHLVPACWNFPGKEGKTIRVLAFSNAHEVELFLNGKSLGKKEMTNNSYVEWKVKYAPGRLEAKGLTNGRVIASDLQETVGAPARIQLSPDKRTLRANAEDALVVPVSILDAQGRFVPVANDRVTFTVEGAGRLVGVSDGNPADHDPDRGDQLKAFNGRCIAIIEAGPNPGKIVLTATAPGLAPATVTIHVK